MLPVPSAATGVRIDARAIGPGRGARAEPGSGATGRVLESGRDPSREAVRTLKFFPRLRASAIAEAPCVYETEELIAAFGDRLSTGALDSLRRMQIDRRCSVVEDYAGRLLTGKSRLVTTTTELASRALEGALEREERGAEAIGLLIAVSNTQTEIIPGLAPAVLDRLRPRLAPSLPLLNLQGLGCSALLKAVEAARWYLREHPDRLVAITAAESQTVFGYELAKRKIHSLRELRDGTLGRAADAVDLELAVSIIQGFLFGDGAVALILGAEGAGPGFGPIVHRTNTEPGDIALLAIPIGGTGDPCIAGERIQRYVMHPDVPKIGARYAIETVDALCVETGLSRSEMAALPSALIHTGSRKILDEVAARLGIDPASPSLTASREVLRRQANLSSVSLGFMLAEHRFPPGKGLMVGFGVGFSASAALVDFPA